MLTKLISKIHFFIIAYFCFGAYEIYLEHQETFEFTLASKESVQVQIDKKQKDKATIKEFSKNVDVAREKVKQITEELETLKKKLPSNISEREDISSFEEIANNLNMKNISISPGEVEDKGLYTIKRYNLKAQGTYLQFLILLEKISKFERLINIQSVLLEIPEEKIRGRYQLLNTNTVVESFIRSNNKLQDVDSTPAQNTEDEQEEIKES